MKNIHFSTPLVLGSAISNYMYLIIIHDVFMIQVRNTTDVAKKKILKLFKLFNINYKLKFKI